MPRAGWLAAGCLLAALASVEAGPPGAAVVAAGAAIAAALVALARRVRPRRNASVRQILLTALGAALVAARLLAAWLVMPPAPAVLPAGAGPWPADVVSPGGTREGVQRAVIGIVGGSGGGLRLYAQLPLYPEVVPGDRVLVAGRVRPPPDDGFGDYLRRAGILGTLTATRLERLPAGSAPLAWLEERRRTAGDLVGRVLPEPEAGLAAGMALGLRERVDRSLAADFTASGLSHVVAISGWNIAIVAGAIGALLRGLRRRPRSVVVVTVIALYAVAAGGGPSVVRAALMASAVVAARESGRGSHAGTALGLTAAAMLVADPVIGRDPGFQLSAAATAGILAWARPLTEALRRRLPGVVPDPIVETLGLSLAAQAVTLPIVLADFGRLSLVSPVANLVAAPLIVPAMGASAVALVAGWVISLPGPPALDNLVVAAGGALGTVCWAALGALVGVVRAAAAVPFASIDLPQPLNLAAAAGVCAAGWMAWLRLGRPGLGRPAALDSGHRATPGRPPPCPRRPARARPQGGSVRLVRRFVLLAGAALVALILVAGARPDGRLRVTILDVGQGDAILVEGPRGGRMLVDGGPDPARLIAQLDARVPPWNRAIDLAVVTHLHDDHLAGLPALLRRYAVGDIRAPPLKGGGEAAEALDTELRAAGLVARALGAGDTISLGGASALVLWPAQADRSRAPTAAASGATDDLDNDEMNDTSVVIELRYGARRVLLTGDITEKADAGLLAARIDVLKVAHHGSRTSTSPAFLAVARPAIAVISVGSANRYGHPDEQTLTRLRDAGARVLRTDQDGWVAVTTDGRDLRVETAEGSTGNDASFDVPRGALAHRITSWQYPPGQQPLRSCSRSIHQTGSSRTSARSPRSRRSSPRERTPVAFRWTVAWSRPPPSFMTWTS